LSLFQYKEPDPAKTAALALFSSAFLQCEEPETAKAFALAPFRLRWQSIWVKTKVTA
jgi:hypothetical protein